MKTVRVAAAVLCDNMKNKSRILATARGYGEFRGKWEFPGGKIEEGEGPREALLREIKEELNIEVRIGDLVERVEYDYPSFHLSMDCFWAEAVSGSLELRAASEARWLSREELESVDWLPADKDLVRHIGSKMGPILQSRAGALAYGLSFDDTYQESPFRDENWQLVRYRPNKKAFLWVYERNGHINLNVKAVPDRAWFWRSAYPSVTAGYHQNKEHWNTIILDGSIPDEDVACMIAESYNLISHSPTKRIYEAVCRIPYGRVATYSQIAELAGDRKMARAVGNALHKNPDPDRIPCFRVVNAKGELAGGFAFGGAEVQAALLEAEGVEVYNNRVDLSRFQWEPVSL